MDEWLANNWLTRTVAALAYYATVSGPSTWIILLIIKKYFPMQEMYVGINLVGIIWMTFGPGFGVRRLGYLEEYQHEKIPVLITVFIALLLSIAAGLESGSNTALGGILLMWLTGSIGFLLPYFKTLRHVMHFVMWFVVGGVIGIVVASLSLGPINLVLEIPKHLLPLLTLSIVGLTGIIFATIVIRLSYK